MSGQLRLALSRLSLILLCEGEKMQPTLFDELPKIDINRYWVPTTDKLPACDTCINYAPEHGRFGSGCGTCRNHGNVDASGYCGLHTPDPKA